MAAVATHYFLAFWALCAFSSLGEAVAAAAAVFYFPRAAAAARLHRRMEAGAPSFMTALPFRSCLPALPGGIPRSLPATIHGFFDCPKDKDFSLSIFLLVRKQNKIQAKLAVPLHRPKAYGIKPLRFSPLFIPFPFGSLNPRTRLPDCFLFFCFFFYKQFFLRTKGTIRKSAIKFFHHLKTKSMEMQIVGRITKNAKVSTTKSGKEVINFDVAVNERYKVKATGELKSSTKFIQCSMWRGTSLAQYLTKGKLLQLTGDIDARGYLSKEGKPVAALTLRVIKLTFLDKSNDKANARPAAAAIEASETVDDLSF